MCFVFFFCPVVTWGYVGPVAITVLLRDRRRQHGTIYPGRRSSQYGLIIGVTHCGCFGQHYLLTLFRGLAGYSVAQTALNLSMFLTGSQTDNLQIPKHVAVELASSHTKLTLFRATNLYTRVIVHSRH